jgi:hypothetical protein
MAWRVVGVRGVEATPGSDAMLAAVVDIEQDLKGANIGVASRWREGWEDLRHGLLLSLPRCAGSARRARS